MGPVEIDTDYIDPENIDALREAIGHKIEHTFPLRLPNGRKLPLKVRECGIAELMEASNGEKQPRGNQRVDFSSRTWRRAAIKKLNIALTSHKFVDDVSGKHPDLMAKELPFSLLRGDDFNALMELAFPGYLAGSEDILNSVDAIRDGPGKDVSGSDQSDPGGC